MGNNISFATCTYDEAIQYLNGAQTQLMLTDDRSSIHAELSMQLGRISSNPNFTDAQKKELAFKTGALIGASM